MSRVDSLGVCFFAFFTCFSFFGVSSTALAQSWPYFAPVQALLEGQQPETSGLAIDLPLVAEDGASVPLSIAFTGALAAEDSLVSLRVFATENPKPEVIDFYFFDPRVLPQVATRIRLNQSQSVIVVAKTQAGRLWVAERPVRVTVSGCLPPGAEGSAAPEMQQPRLALPRRIQAERAFEVRSLLQHPMETGLREDASGQQVAQALVERLQVRLDDDPVFATRFYTGTAANPRVHFRLQLEAKASQAPWGLVLTWEDDQGQTLTEKRHLRPL